MAFSAPLARPPVRRACWLRRILVGLATIVAAGPLVARAGGGPENLFLVVNPTSSDSIAVPIPSSAPANLSQQTLHLSLALTQLPLHQSVAGTKPPHLTLQPPRLAQRADVLHLRGG
jgi:hypothetical protein